MLDLRKAKAYDEMMTKVVEARRDLMTAQGKAYVVGLHDFNDRLIDLQHQIENLRKELAKAYSAMEIEEP